MRIKEDLLAVATPEGFNEFKKKYPNLKLTGIDAEMKEHLNGFIGKWNKGPREVNGVHYDIRKKKVEP